MANKELTASDITMCAQCNGPLIGNSQAGNFYRVKVAIALPNVAALRARFHLAGLMGGSGALAETFAPTPFVATELPAETLNICFECATKALCLASYAEMEREGDDGLDKAISEPGGLVNKQ